MTEGRWWAVLSIVVPLAFAGSFAEALLQGGQWWGVFALCAASLVLVFTRVRR